MLEDSPAILNSNIIQGNISGLGPEGGGVSIRNFDSGDITLSGNTFSGNISQYACGGISAAANRITMTGNAILSNTAQHFGGGVCTYGSATLSDNIISGNVVTGSNSSAEGGGAAIEAYPREALVKLVNNVITDNRVNSPDGRGSGMVIAASSNGYLLHTTIARNTGGDGSGICIAYNSTTALTNTILVSQTVGITATAGNTVTVNGVLWYGNGANTAGAGAIAVTHSITDDPAFAPDGYHLTAGSAAIDAGVDAGVTTDIDGEHRPQGSAPDLGADEISLRYVYLPLVLRQSP
jgi:fibronectin-binding autotransporter adhesin